MSTIYSKNEIMKNIFAVLMTVSLLLSVAVVFTACSSSSKEFTVGELAFCSEESHSETDCYKQLNAKYEAGKIIWMGLLVNGLEIKEQDDGDMEISITSTIKVIDANGDTVDEWIYPWQGNYSSSYIEGNGIPDNVWLLPRINYSFHCTDGLPDGKYTVSIDVSDDFSGQTRHVQGDFYIASEA